MYGNSFNASQSTETAPLDTDKPAYDDELDDLIDELALNTDYSIGYDDQWLNEIIVRDGDLNNDARESDNHHERNGSGMRWNELYGELCDPFNKYGELSETPVIDANEYSADLEDSINIAYTPWFDDAVDYPEIRVIKQEMPDGLFGFTNTEEKTEKRSIHVSDNLYKIDEATTIPHEKTHQRFPGKDELTIRYINGDIDPGNTLSLAQYSHGVSWSNEGLSGHGSMYCR